jgi:SAM-dependent methyltransferase
MGGCKFPRKDGAMPGFYAQIARYYDAENTDKNDDLPFYLQLAEQVGGPIMDIGCGTGRVMFPLARAGYEVHGIDNEAAMLEVARRQHAQIGTLRGGVTFHEGDVLTYPLDAKFRLMLVPYNGLMHFHTQSEQLALLRKLRTWTQDDGLLVLDLPNAGDTFATQDTGALMFERSFLEPETGHLVMQHSISTLDRVEQLMRVTWIYDEITSDGTVRRTVAPLTLYYYFLPEIRLLLAATGFEFQDAYGDLDFGPFVDGCERMIVLAKPR